MNTESVIYAVESFNPDKGYSRYDIGSKDEMIKYLNNLIDDSINARNYDSYYRVNEVNSLDVQDWLDQVNELPEVRNVDRLFGDWVQIGTAATYLNVTFGRVFNLVTAGEIRSDTVGRNKLVNVHDIVQRKISNPKAGRPPKVRTTESLDVR